MGFGGISIWQLLIVLVIVVLIFGTKKLRGMGGDLGSAIKSFKKAVKEDDSTKKDDETEGDDAAKAVLEADPAPDDVKSKHGTESEDDKEKRQA